MERCARSAPVQQAVPRGDEIEKIQLLREITPSADSSRATDSGHILYVVDVNTQAMTDQPAGMGRSRVASKADMDRVFLFPLPR